MASTGALGGGGGPLPPAPVPRDKTIVVGSERFKDLNALRCRARTLLLVPATGAARKPICEDAVKWHQSLRGFVAECKQTYDVVPPEMPDTDDEADVDASQGAVGAPDDGDDDEDTSIEAIGRVGKLPATLPIASLPMTRESAGKLLAHMRTPKMLPYMQKIVRTWCDGVDTKEMQLCLCAALLKQYAKDHGPVAGGVDSVDSVEVAPFLGAICNAHVLKSVADDAAALGVAADDDGDDGGEREAIFTMNDFARLISLLVHEKAAHIVDAYRSSLSRSQMDAGMRNDDLFKALATLYNDKTIQLKNPDADEQWVNDMDPNAASIFEHQRSGSVLSKKWADAKAAYSKACARVARASSARALSPAERDAPPSPPSPRHRCTPTSRSLTRANTTRKGATSPTTSGTRAWVTRCRRWSCTCTRSSTSRLSRTSRPSASRAAGPTRTAPTLCCSSGRAMASRTCRRRITWTSSTPTPMGRLAQRSSPLLTLRHELARSRFARLREARSSQREHSKHARVVLVAGKAGEVAQGYMAERTVR